MEYIKQKKVGKQCYKLLTCPSSVISSLSLSFFSLVSRCCQDSCSLTVSLLALSVILTLTLSFCQCSCSLIIFQYVREREKERKHTVCCLNLCPLSWSLWVLVSRRICYSCSVRSELQCLEFKGLKQGWCIYKDVENYILMNWWVEFRCVRLERSNLQSWEAFKTRIENHWAKKVWNKT